MDKVSLDLGNGTGKTITKLQKSLTAGLFQATSADFSGRPAAVVCHHVEEKDVVYSSSQLEQHDKWKLIYSSSQGFRPVSNVMIRFMVLAWTGVSQIV